jgi:hypothetical protein
MRKTTTIIDHIHISVKTMKMMFRNSLSKILIFFKWDINKKEILRENKFTWVTHKQYQVRALLMMKKSILFATKHSTTRGLLKLKMMSERVINLLRIKRLI